MNVEESARDEIRALLEPLGKPNPRQEELCAAAGQDIYSVEPANIVRKKRRIRDGSLLD